MDEARLEELELELNPDGNERLTAGVGLVLLVLAIVEVATVVFGLHSHLSLHVFVGLVLIPPVLLKLASTGWRFSATTRGVRRTWRRVRRSSRCGCSLRC